MAGKALDVVAMVTVVMKRNLLAKGCASALLARRYACCA